jgi:hypothetical protein
MIFVEEIDIEDHWDFVKVAEMPGMVVVCGCRRMLIVQVALR